MTWTVHIASRRANERKFSFIAGKVTSTWSLKTFLEFLGRNILLKFSFSHNDPHSWVAIAPAFHAGDRGSILWRNTNYFWLLHWFYLINSWKINLFFSVSCQGTKTVMLLPHTDMIIEQYPKEFFLVHWEKNIILFPLRGASVVEIF